MSVSNTSLLHERVKITQGSAAVAATTSETTTAVVDMQGWDRVRFIVHFGDCANGSVITITPKENTASSVSSPTPTAISLATLISGSGALSSGTWTITATATSCDNKYVIIDLARHAISKRYVFLSITATTANYALNGITIEQYSPRNLAVSQSSDVLATAVAAL